MPKRSKFGFRVDGLNTELLDECPTGWAVGMKLVAHVRVGEVDGEGDGRDGGSGGVGSW